MKSFLHDLRFALRQLRKAPGFTSTAVLTLAFGIGATTSIFSIVEGVLLRPLPFPRQDSLVTMGDQLEAGGTDALPTPQVTAAEIPVYTREAVGFSSVGAYQQTGYELSGGGEPVQISAARLSASIFPVLGVAPLKGSVFTEGEDVGGERIAVVSYGLWKSRFHGDAGILGKKILLDRKPYEVIGVMPREFEFPLVPGQLNRSELWVPLSLSPEELADFSNWNYKMVGRLKPGVSAAAAQAQLNRVTQEVIRGFPKDLAGLSMHAVVVRVDENTTAEAKPLVRTLLLAVTVVLFIACANLASLLLVRGIRRRREVAVRLALGASKSSVLRQILTETLALSLCGGALGLLLAWGALRVGVHSLPETLPRVSAIGLDLHVVGFALLLAAVTGVVCGLVPAVAAAQTGVTQALKEGGRTGTEASGHVRLRSALVVAEIAVSLVLLVAAGLLLRSFQKLRSVNLGFRTEHALTASYNLPHQTYSTQPAVNAFNDRLLQELERQPGVEAVGITSQLPVPGQGGLGSVYGEGYAPPKGAGLGACWPSQVLGSYFRAAGIPLLRGRAFTAADRAGAPLVVVVNRTLAEHFWPGKDPVGRRLHWGLQNSVVPWMTVVGEIGDVKQSGADAETQEQVYQPADQASASYGNFAPPGSLNGDGGSIVVRGATAPDQLGDTLRAAVRRLDPQLPLTHVEPLESVIEEGEAPRIFNTAVISAFATAAVLLALLGIYSVIAFSAALRTPEMAIRLALGAQRSGVVRLIVASGARLGLLGCVIGGVGALFATRLLRSLLFEVSPADPAVLIAAMAAIFLLALAASAVPARRAAMVEPVEALRSE